MAENDGTLTAEPPGEEASEEASIDKRHDLMLRLLEILNQTSPEPGREDCHDHGPARSRQCDERLS
jgi:hypothetical protein